MSDEASKLIAEFLSLCFEQRQLSSEEEQEERKEEHESKREQLRVSSMKLSKKLYTKAAELERAGDITKGKH